MSILSRISRHNAKNLQHGRLQNAAFKQSSHVISLQSFTQALLYICVILCEFRYQYANVRLSLRCGFSQAVNSVLVSTHSDLEVNGGV